MSRSSWLAVVLLVLPSGSVALSGRDAQLARSRLQEALSSPSGKMTVSPELVIPEPKDPTALLLQSTAVQGLSEKVRSQAKANAAWLSGSVNSLKTFCGEQETARGNFPGPIPVVYCPSDECSSEELEEIADAGASGVVVTVQADGVSSDEGFASKLASVLEQGLQPIPEVVLENTAAAACTEEDVTALVATLTNAMGSEPASVLLTVNAVVDEEDKDTEVAIPRVPKPLAKKVPIIGSVRVPVGENRIGQETARLKEAGFTGALLRSECVPGFRMNPDLEFVGKFWSACISDLKSTRSKSFSFRAASQLGEGQKIATEWANYQKDVMDSGSLGDMNDNYTPVDEASGEYMGF